MKKNKHRLDAEERDMIESSERGEWVSVGDIEAERAFWQKAAQEALARLKPRAVEEG